MLKGLEQQTGFILFPKSATLTFVQQPQSYISVSDLIRVINSIFEEATPRILFKGELQEVNLWSSGHLYFTLKDAESQVPCVMWRSHVAALGFKPKDGDAVQCEGRPNVYSKTGRMQVVVSKMDLQGQGVLLKKFNELKAKLEKEGLFAPERKRKLPLLPKKIGIVTSVQGAVIHDIEVRIRKRMPHLEVVVCDVKVQGEGAAKEIAAGIQRLQEMDLDVIIVARGGGSLEDLWSFNEEVVVRAVYGSKIPVVSGVGHEVDVTLCDLVADVRAPTPTAAAEIVVPDCKELLRVVSEFKRRLLDVDRWFAPLGQGLDELSKRIQSAVALVIERARRSLHAYEVSVKLISPDALIAREEKKLRTIQELLASQYKRFLAGKVNALHNASARLEKLSPKVSLESARGKLLRVKDRLSQSVQTMLEQRRRRIGSIDAKLGALSPLKVLERGYSVVLNEKGESVKHGIDVSPGDSLSVRVHDGKFNVTVSGK